MLFMISLEADLPQNSKTVTDWCSFFREEAENYVIRHSPEIGGIYGNGEQITVEVDETKFFHRKYHRGQWREGHWVMGGIERGSGRCFLVEVPNRIQSLWSGLYGTTCYRGHVTDKWKAYDGLSRIGHEIYTHATVSHSRNFVDQHDPEVHTENILSMWSRAKKKIHRQHGTSEALFPSYVHEFLFRTMVKDKDIFTELILCIGETYLYENMQARHCEGHALTMVKENFLHSPSFLSVA